MLNERRIKILILIVFIAIFFGNASYVLFKYYDLTKDKYVTYSESSKINYGVIYKNNGFFKDKGSTNNKYITSLIDHIKADFNYDISFNDNINYNYSYKIVADISITDNNNGEESVLYKDSEILYDSSNLTGSDTTSIKKQVNIDFIKYNNLVNTFIKTYDLKDMDSSLRVSMFLKLKTTGNTNVESLNKKATISMSMPLDKKTVGIDLSNNLPKSDERKILIKNDQDYLKTLVVGLIELFISIMIAIYTFIYIKKTRTIKSIYTREIKKIMSNYDGYIQKINNKYKIGTSQVIKVNKFEDMLEIRDTLKKPILMLENERKDGTFFIIPATNGVIYAYALRIIDIIARKNGENAPDYDLKNIDKEIPKKYTSEYIDKQIQETKSLSTIDLKNTIEGNENKDTDLYDQLDNTMVMKPIELKKTRKKITNKKSTNTKK